MKKLFINNLTSCFILGFALLLSGGIIAFAQGTPALSASSSAPIKITFPIAELGNCANEAVCRAYCEKQENIIACTNFGEKQGLISSEEAARAKEFADVLKGEGPGGCKDKQSCETYCNGTAHLDECLAFVEKHNLGDPADIAEGQKIATALKSGASLPGGCTSKESCNTYCSKSENMEDCLAFAEKAGMMSQEKIDEAKKVLPFLKQGTTPGGCNSKESCDTYCAVDTHFNECISFAEKAGLVSAEEAAIAKKSGGKGPGGCNSKESCDAYCNKEENHDACFTFAKSTGILSDDQVKEIEAGMGRLRAGLDQMPPELVSCLNEKLGTTTLNKIQSGALTPSRDTGDTIKSCVDAFMPQVKDKVTKALGLADASTTQCLESKLGKDALDKIKAGDAPSPENGDVFRSCFESMKNDGLKKAQTALQKMPPEMLSCVEKTLGSDTITKIKNGDTSAMGPEVGTAFQSCSGNIKEQAMSKLETDLSQMPESARSCVKSKLGNFESDLSSGAISPEKVQSVVAECMKDIVLPSSGSGAPQGAPAGIPTGMTNPAGGENGIPSEPNDQTCAMFKSAPSCDYVPTNVRSLCEKCK